MGFFNDPTAYVLGCDDGRGVKIPAKDFASVGSGGGSMLVTVSVDTEASIQQQEPVFKTDKAYDEIITAANTGMTVTAKFMEVFLFLCAAYNDHICFAAIPAMDTDAITNMVVEIHSDGTVRGYEKAIMFNDTAIANGQ